VGRGLDFSLAAFATRAANSSATSIAQGPVFYRQWKEQTAVNMHFKMKVIQDNDSELINLITKIHFMVKPNKIQYTSGEKILYTNSESLVPLQTLTATPVTKDQV
jgi:mevalonate pyrophosphate decarboxylase